MAGSLSGIPSTLHAVATSRSPLAAARAAGELLGRPGLGRGLLAHGVMTMGWTVVLVTVLPRRAATWWGAAAGLAIGVADLAAADRRFPVIAALPRRPQLADHVAFGALVGLVVVVRTGPATTRPAAPHGSTSGSAGSGSDMQPVAPPDPPLGTS